MDGTFPILPPSDDLFEPEPKSGSMKFTPVNQFQKLIWSLLVWTAIGGHKATSPEVDKVSGKLVKVQRNAIFDGLH